MQLSAVKLLVNRGSPFRLANRTSRCLIIASSVKNCPSAKNHNIPHVDSPCSPSVISKGQRASERYPPCLVRHNNFHYPNYREYPCMLNCEKLRKMTLSLPRITNTACR